MPRKKIEGLHQDYTMDLTVETCYLPDHSDEEEKKFTFSYKINIKNTGKIGARLMTRHWFITEGENELGEHDVKEIKGEGVVGEHPHLYPGEEFEYTSHAVVNSPVASMEGAYSFIADDGSEFDAPIPRFILSMPRTVH